MSVDPFHERVVVACLGGCEIDLDWSDGDQDGRRDPAIVAAVSRFLGKTHDERPTSARHLVAYRDDFLSDMDEESAPVAEAAVWGLVQPGTLTVATDRGRVYVVLEAECEWEPEHGLLVSWIDGDRIVRIGPYDGHPTNMSADVDPTIVYEACDERFTTRV